VKPVDDVTTLGYALLGLLARRERSGYDLARELRRPVGYFWQARHSQIYPELARLEAQGLVAHHVVAQHDRPDKKVYAITEAGREALRTWVTAPLEEPPVRDELVLRAYSVWLADPEAAAAFFREHGRRHEARLAHYRELEAQMVRDAGGVPPPVATPEFAAYATLQRGLGRVREYAAWCRWLAERLEASTSEGQRRGRAPRLPEGDPGGVGPSDGAGGHPGRWSARLGEPRRLRRVGRRRRAARAGPPGPPAGGGGRARPSTSSGPECL
jgi:DNA-binding PadR family transcriptional regulator